LLELCAGLEADPLRLLGFALQRAKVLLESITLHVDLGALLDNHNHTFRPMHQWARNKLNQYPDGVAPLAASAVDELADFIGCARADLAVHLARFIPDAGYE
jgi:hypothetical protein